MKNTLIDLKKALLLIAISVLSSSVCFAAAVFIPLKLDEGKPLFIIEAAQLAYEASVNYKPTSKKKSRWLWNGSPLYRACYTNEHMVLLQTIIDNPEQKIFYVVDFGSGDHRWVDATADFINEQVKQGKIPRDVTVNIIGLTGETYENVKAQSVGNCVIHKYGQFKLEDFETEFDKIDGLKGAKFDLAMCNMTLRHLVDPVRTYLSIRNRVKAHRYFFFDKFPFLYENENSLDYVNKLLPLEHMLALLVDIGDPFLFESTGAADIAATQRSVVKVSDKMVNELPMSYVELEQINGSWFNSVVNSITVFKKFSPDRKLSHIKSDSCGSCYGENYTLYGSSALFNELDGMKAWAMDGCSKNQEKPTYKEIPWQ